MEKKITKRRIVLAMVSLCLFISCSKSSDTTTASYTEDCSTAKSFAGDVNPVIQESCTVNSGCHASGSRDGVLTTYAQIYAQRSSIYTQVKNGKMPEGSTLTAAQKNAVLCWISSGAADN